MSPLVHFACVVVADLIVSGVVALPIACGVVRVLDRIEGRWGR